MTVDQELWNRLNHEHCSFKEKGPVQSLCRNEYNVNGLCSRSTCPLANQQYATVLEKEGICYLYMKTPERAHSPKHMWEKVKIAKNFLQGLQQISKNLEHWPEHHINRCKQRLTKLRQMTTNMRQLAVPQGSSRGTNLVPIKRKTERREATREKKAEAAAQLEKSIGGELLARLKAGIYGDRYKVPQAEQVEQSSNKRRQAVTEDSGARDEFVALMDDEEEFLEEEREAVKDAEVRELNLEGRHRQDSAAADIENLVGVGTARKPLPKKRRKQRLSTKPRVVIEYPRVELEMEQELC